MRTNRFYPKFLTGQRVVVLVLLAVIVVMVGILLARPASTTVPSSAEIAEKVNGPAQFQRPSAMKYIPETDSCVVGGTVTSTEWHVGTQIVGVGAVDGKTVGYTSFGFRSDAGREFTVSETGALYTDPGENLGLELRCDPATMNTAPSFGMIAIIYGGK